MFPFIAELMETNTFKKFTSTLELIFDCAEDLDLNADLGNTPKFVIECICAFTDTKLNVIFQS